MSYWSYVQTGSISDEVVEGVTSEQLLELAYDGKIRPKTHVFHTKHTKNEWVTAERVPAVLQKCNDGIEFRRQRLAEQVEKQRQWVQSQASGFADSLRFGASLFQTARSRLFPVQEPQLRRCVSGQHHDFSKSSKCGVCKQPTIAMAGSEWDEMNREFIDPFLVRNELNGTAGELPANAIVLTHLKTLDRAATVIVTDSELMMLQQVLRDAFPCKDREEARVFMSSCALRSDFLKFRARIEALERTSLDVFAAYVSVVSHDPTFIPFLQQLFKERNEQKSVEAIRQTIDQVRRQNQLHGFAADLSRRRTDSISITIEMVDSMDPFNFELLLGIIYETRGYRVTETPKGSDQGADVFIEKAGIKAVIQAKLYADSVGNKAVQEVIAARSLFRCHNAIVVTNSNFTKSASELARTSDVELIERSGLIALIEEFNRSPKDYSRLSSLFFSRLDGTP